ncbi:VapE domain-containing protein [Dysgonomonas macrotermitis]|uniref:Virulence-associated protein E-like domain-containing protein n=1 Tax=Dysgonomonas macrotermitis TaxID=1346286 RepID=A0A1M4UM91_9BACT|nr:VapE domain-containing protein [Dysgonomonas macrotermitis]SHE57690.1 protein of unknown function [Dysgonomonas macrotermitis]
MAQYDKLETNKPQKDLFSDEIQNIVSFLQEHYDIRIPAHDPSKIKISCKDESRYNFPPSSDDIWLHMKSEGYSVSESVLRKILRSPNYITPFNPITDYFDNLRKKFKGESQIDLLAKHIIPRCFDDNTPEYYRSRTDKLLKKWFVACVACWMGNIPNDVALGFIHSREGIGKTWLIEFFMPESLREYHVKSSRDDRKFEMEDAFTRYMLINFDEFEGINNRNIDQFKKCMSDKAILNKRRHEEYPTEKDRIGCAAFTSNRNQEKGGFLKESYGYRRFGIIELEDINHDYRKVVDIDQLWAEALNLYEETDFDYIFGLSDFEEFQTYNRRFLEETIAMKYILMYLTVPESKEEGENLNATDIHSRLRKLVKREHLSDFTVNKIGTALTALGYSKVSYRDGNGNPLKGYHVKFIE